MKTLSATPVDKLSKGIKLMRYTFYMYTGLEVVFVIVAGWQGYSLLSVVMGLSDSVILTLLLMFGVMNIINFFMLFVIWFCMEASYYKMVENQMDLMVYLKQKLGE